MTNSEQETPLRQTHPTPNGEVGAEDGDIDEPGRIRTKFDRWLRVGDVSHALAISTQRVQTYINEGRLRYVRTPLGKLIDPVSVRELDSSRKKRPAA